MAFDVDDKIHNFLGGFKKAFALFLEVYLYIGIASLCLYSTPLFRIFQDGMMSKITRFP